MGIFIGVVSGLFLASGIAYLIAIHTLCKSNDFGSEEVDLQQFAGYDPVVCENMGQAKNPYDYYR